jgi:hypothetical protein
MTWPDVSTNSFKFEVIGKYNPLASTLLAIEKTVWPDGSKNTPADMFEDDSD